MTILIHLFLISARNINIDSDRRVKRGIDNRVPVRVGKRILAKEKRFKPSLSHVVIPTKSSEAGRVEGSFFKIPRLVTEFTLS